jgi:hypothetical protein
MQFNRKSAVTGMSSPPSVRCFLPSVNIPRAQTKLRSIHQLTNTFHDTPKIPYSAGGSHGDEFRPD